MSLDDLARQKPPAAPPLSSALEAELAALQPVLPRRPKRQLSTLVAMSVVYGAGLLAALTLRRDIEELPTAWIVGAGLLWSVGFVAPIYLALVPRAGSMMPRWPVAAISAVIASVAFVALGLLVHPSGPSSLDYSNKFVRGHWCLELGLAVAIVPVLLGALALRRAVPVGSRWIAAALGAGGGCLGGLVLHLYCRIADGMHIGIIHGGVVLVAALLSAALVPRVTQ